MSDPVTLLTVQGLDTHLDQLRHRRASLPERERLADIDRAVSELFARAEAAGATVLALQSDRRHREDELATLETKIAKIEEVMYASSAGRDLQAMGEEVKAMRARDSELEDAVLELLEQIDEADAAVEALRSAGRELAEAREEAQIACTAAEAEIDAEVATLEAARAAATGQLSAALLAEYDAIRGRLGGVGAAELVGNRCAGCHLTMASAEVERIRHAPPDEIVHCEECGRILVR